MIVQKSGQMEFDMTLQKPWGSAGSASGLGSSVCVKEMMEKVTKTLIFSGCKRK